MPLPRKNRLTDKKDFDMVFKEGNAVKGNFLFIKYKKNTLTNSRVAFIVPIKVAGNAANRNRIKRIFSEQIRKKITDFKSKYDIVITLKRKEKEDSLKHELMDLLN